MFPGLFRRGAAVLTAVLAVAAGMSAQAPDFTGGETGLFAPKAPKAAQAELVTDRESVAPGETFRLALVLSHPPHHHTYWKNPGDAGDLTKIKWKELSGVTTGPWLHPEPKLFRQDTILNFVHEGKTRLLIPATAPAGAKPGDTLTLSGTASWLLCDDSSCMPGEAAVSIRIPVTAAGAPADEGLFREAVAALPEPAPSGSATFATSPSGAAKLIVAASALAGRDPAGAMFFPASENLPASAALVKPLVTPDGGIEFAFSDPKFADAKSLEGVITFKKGRALEVSAPAGEKANPVKSDIDLPLSLLLAFGGGMLLNIMPCVFPVLGLKIYALVKKAHDDPKKILAHALVFSAGIVVSFWALAALVIALKSGALTLFDIGGKDIGWGFLLQIPWFVAAITTLFLVMATGMAGVFEFGTGVQAAAGSVEDRTGYAGSFLSGALATLVSTPCAGPGMAPALAAAFATDATGAVLIFTALALGLATPFVVLAAAPGLLKKLPRPGPWMESFKQGMSFMLFGSAVYFAWVLGGQIDSFSFLIALFALLAVAAACWVYGRWCVPHRSRGARRGGLVATLILAAGSWCALHAAFRPGLEWEAWTPETQARHLASGETVFVDFTARWCATCQVNKRVFASDAVSRAFADNKIVPLEADWSKRDGVIAAELKKYGQVTIPFNVVLKAGEEPKTLPSVLTESAVIEAVSGE